MADAVVEFEAHREALAGHCYRMLGSAVDTDDAVQETLIRAWKSYERFDGRSSLRTWLTRIATNVCLDALASRKARVRPIEDGPRGSLEGELRLETRPRTHWLEPIDEARALPKDADPAERAALRQSIRLAFVAALQKLPARQRAALLLSDVLGWSAAEIAGTLELSIAAVNSALQRARATLEGAGPTSPAALSPEQAATVDRYVAAFERYDLDALTALLRQDAVLSMPPYTMWLQGPEVIQRWMAGPGAGCRGSRVRRVEANGQPAFAQWRPAPAGGWHAWALVVLELQGPQVSALTSFLDVETLFPRFGLPLDLPPAV